MESKRIGTRSLVAFFVLTFGFSWAIWLPKVLAACDLSTGLEGLPVVGAFGPTVAGEHVVGAMEAHDVEWFVTPVSAGVRHEDDGVSLGGRLVVGAMKVLARETLVDARSHVAAVRASDLRWTVVRPRTFRYRGQVPGRRSERPFPYRY